MTEGAGKPEDVGKPEHTGISEEQEFQRTIDGINGTTWTMSIEGETWTVDVSEAEIEGEPSLGLEAEVKGTVVAEDDTVVASWAEVKGG